MSSGLVKVQGRRARAGNPERAAPGARQAMLARVAWWVRLALWWFFAKVDFDERLVAKLREAAGQGQLVYALPSLSLFDFLYFNYAFSRHGLPLARWSNGRSTVWLRPLWSALAWALGRRGRFGSSAQQLRGALDQGHPALVFLSKPRASEAESRERTLKYFAQLAEVARERVEGQPRLLIVPLRVIWERRADDVNPTFLDELFGGRQRPGFFRKAYLALSNVWQPFFMMGKPLVQVGLTIDVADALASAPARALGPEAAGPNPDGLSSPNPDALTLRAAAADQLDQILSVVVGPRLKGSTALKAEIVQDPLFLRKIARVVEAQEEAGQGGPSRADHIKRARHNLDKIAADFSMVMIKFMGAALTPIWRIIYDGLDVDHESLERVRETARHKRVVVIPSHKSHIDYLILSYVFFQRGLLPPHIAAGDNLDFPPVGSIFRRCGAFFMKRSFKGDDVYAACLQHYLGKLLAEGFPLEFFIEGGRSRTGKLLSPRFGLLRMILDSFLERDDIPDIALVPCAVTYERVVEAGGYQKELMGGQKRQENLGALLRSTRALTSKYGRLFVSFAQPIDLRDYIRRYLLDQPDDQHTDGERQGLTQRLGYRVIYEINQATAMTPTALAALALLNHQRRAITLQEVLCSVGFVLRHGLRKRAQLAPALRTCLASRRAQLHLRTPRADDAAQFLEQIDADTTSAAATLAHPDHSRSQPALAKLQPDADDQEQRLAEAVSDLVREALSLFERGKLVEHLPSTPNRGAQDPNPARWRALDAARGELAYYKNTILHTLVPEALLATALLSDPAPTQPIDAAMARTNFLSRLFKYEFIYEERAEFENVFWRTFRDFESEGWVQDVPTAQPPCARLPLDTPRGGQGPCDLGGFADAPGSAALHFFRLLTLPLLEAYALTLFEAQSLAADWITERDLIARILQRVRTPQALAAQGRDALPRPRTSESLSQPTLQNALRLFEDWKLIEGRSVERLRRRVRQVRCQPGVDPRQTLTTLATLAGWPPPRPAA
jgi:glycerol-3-phosphate O-acyltransferase